MTTRYDRERIHRLFLKERGNIRAVMGYKGTPKSPNTIRRYAKEGRWHEELLGNLKSEKGSGNKCKRKNENSNKGMVDISKLEQIKEIIYEFLVPNTSERIKTLILRPKTYSEAIKCYLEVDSRIDEKREKLSNSNFGKWEEIIRQIGAEEDIGNRGH